MKFRQTTLSGAYVLDPEPVLDARGSFSRVFCAREYALNGMNTQIAQCSVSYNAKRGTLRGLHYQAAPNEEAKTVRCVRGAVYDVIADLRSDSATRYQWFGIELSAIAGNAVYVPSGCAHGFITLEDETFVEYLISDFYVAEAARGIRYDDPTLAISWPMVPTLISDRDLRLPVIQKDQDV